MVPPGIFSLYGLAFFATIWTVDRLPARFVASILVFQGLLAGGLSFIIYQLGFGYDPFVHQAAERYLVSHGTLAPASILYAGHYGLIVFLARLTSIDPALIDRALIPLLSPLALLWAGSRALYTWTEKPLRRLSLVALWLVPFLPLTFTVPHNLTYLILVVMVLLLPTLIQKQGAWLGVSPVALTIHPLLELIATLL